MVALLIEEGAGRVRDGLIVDEISEASARLLSKHSCVCDTFWVCVDQEDEATAGRRTLWSIVYVRFCRVSDCMPAEVIGGTAIVHV